MDLITYLVSPEVTNDEMNELFFSAWNNQKETNFKRILDHSLLYICAFSNKKLIGFINVAWDGGIHGFILDISVHSQYQRQGIGTNLVLKAVEEARKKELVWLHVDYENHLEGFYTRCGFFHTKAGLIKLN